MKTISDSAERQGTNYKLTIAFDFATDARSSNALSIGPAVDVKIGAGYNLAIMVGMTSRPLNINRYMLLNEV